MRFRWFSILFVGCFFVQACAGRPLLEYSVVELVSLHRYFACLERAGVSLDVSLDYEVGSCDLMVASPDFSLGRMSECKDLGRSVNGSPELALLFSRAPESFESPVGMFASVSSPSPVGYSGRSLKSPGSVDDDFEGVGDFWFIGLRRDYLNLVGDSEKEFLKCFSKIKSCDGSFFSSHEQLHVETFLHCLDLAIDLKRKTVLFEGFESEDRFKSSLDCIRVELCAALELLGHGFELALDGWLNSY